MEKNFGPPPPSQTPLPTLRGFPSRTELQTPPCWALPLLSLGGIGWWGRVVLWGAGSGGGRGGGVGVCSSPPVPFFPLRRKILAQRGSLLVSVCLVLVGLATCFCWPTYPSLSWA